MSTLSVANITGLSTISTSTNTATFGTSVYMTASGDVGVGVASPQSPLHIERNVAAEMAVFINNPNASGYSALRIGNSDRGTNGDHLIYGSTVLGLRSKTGSAITFEPAGTERARIDTSGNFQFNSGYGSVATAFGCRAWVNFTATTGTPTIRTSGNMTSITDNGVGDFTFNFTTAMPDTNYAFSSGVLKNEAGIGTTVASLLYGNNGSYTTSALRLVCRQVNDATGSNIDPFTGCVMVYR